MSSINEHNYEAYLLDYIEGRLNAAQHEQLEKFLADHPAVREELEEMEILQLNDTPMVAYADKSDLKIVSKLDPIGSHNDDLHFIASMEGDLDQEETAALNNFLKENEERVTAFELYQKTKLQPEETIVYDDKSSLKRRKTLIIPMYVRVAAAAAVIAFIFFNLQIGDPQMMEQKGQFNIAAEDNVRKIKPAAQHPLTSFTLAKEDKPQREVEVRIERAVPVDRIKKEEVVFERKEENLVQNEEQQTVPVLEKIDEVIPEQLLVVEEQKPEENTVETSPKENDSEEKTFRVDEYLAHLIKKEVIQKRDTIHNHDQFNLAESVSVGFSELVGAEVELEKDDSGKLSAFEIKIGKFGFSRKKVL